MTELNDHQLLEEYLRHGSDQAFQTLVARHVDFIYSAALRQLRNPHQAQEATQSAFVALAANASKLGRSTVIIGWLHHAAHFAALKIQRAEARRKHWEREAATMSAQDDPQRAFEELEPLVDGAIEELSERDRDAIILRFLRQQSFREVAATLGLTEEAAKKRVTRALEKLRGLLARRGVVIPAAVLAAGLSQLTLTAAPAGLPASLGTLAPGGAPSTNGFGSILAKLCSVKMVQLASMLGVLVLVGFFLYPRTQPPMKTSTPSTVRIKLTSVLVNDQEKALRFYTDVLGFVKKSDLPTGPARWLTVASPARPEEIELLLEPTGFAPALVFQKALHDSGIPLTAFSVDDLAKEHARLTAAGVVFTQPPTPAGPVTVAVFEDTCGNLIQLVQAPLPPGVAPTPGIRLSITSVMVGDQAKALRFYSEILGLQKLKDIPLGGGRWLTLVAKDGPTDVELLLEPMGFPAAKVYQKELYQAGIPLTALAVGDLEAEYARLKALGVRFTQPPTKSGLVITAVLDDTCGNLIQLFQK